MSWCKCTGGDSRGGIGRVGDISFSPKNISSYNFSLVYVRALCVHLSVRICPGRNFYIYALISEYFFISLYILALVGNVG